MTAITNKTRALVFSRDGERCASCGVHSPLSIQHRINRGMGGDPKGYRNVLSNLMTLCLFCNGALEGDSNFMLTGIRNGWKAQPWDSAAQVAVYYIWAREWRLLTDEGTYRVVDDSEITRGKKDAPLVLGKAA